VGIKWDTGFHFRVSFKDFGSCHPPDCICDIDKADRGWFERLSEFCGSRGPNYRCSPGINVHDFILSTAIVCGVLWFIAGVSSLAASKEVHCDAASARAGAAISAFVYIVGYVVFVGFFGVIVIEINNRNSSFDKIDLCGDVKRRFRRSGDEYISYSISAFVSIAICIIYTVGSMYAL